MEENLILKSMVEKLRKSKFIAGAIAIAAALALFLFSASFFLDEPLRSSMEKRINLNLKGYSVRLAGLHLQLINLSVTLKGVSIIQQAHPETPVCFFPDLKASIHWREFLSGRLVAEFMLDQPKININLQQLHSEAAFTVPLKERGWQQAVEAVYPLKINSLKINNASVTYFDQDPKRPLVLSHLNLRASNIRNIHQPDQVYPSSFHLDTTVFDTGHGTIDGYANFLTQPHPGIKGHIALEKISLDYFKPMITNANISLRGGILEATGDAEYAPKMKTALLKKLTIRGMNLDYIHSQRTAVVEKKRAAIVKKAVRKLTDNPGILIRADEVVLTECNLGLVNKAAKKPYRLFLADTELTMGNFSNRFAQGPAQARLKAKFMGSGPTTASLNFRPEKSGSDFDLHLQVENTKLIMMNDVLRSYGNFDVSAGTFSLVSELQVKNGAISGYIKPFFKDIQVYDRRKDKDDGAFHKVYERMIGGMSTLLENNTRREVATRVIIKGELNKPETSNWQIAGQLFKNAFFKAILPTFDK